MVKGPQAVTPFVSAIFCLDLGHHKEFLAERGINGAIFAVHQFLRLKFGQKRLVLCQSIINHQQASSSSSIRPNALKLSLAELWSHYVPWQRLLRARSLKVSLSFQPTCRLQNWIRGCSAAGQTIVKIRLKRNALYIPKAGDRSPQLQF